MLDSRHDQVSIVVSAHELLALISITFTAYTTLIANS